MVRVRPRSHSLVTTETQREQPLSPWQDGSLPPDQRVAAAIAEMTLREKVAQLYGVWVGVSSADGEVAPFQHEMDDVLDLDELFEFGLGQLTRSFGSAPVDPAVGALALARTQRRIMSSSRLGRPAISHEECLAGFTAWGATAYPVPLSWGATFNPALIERMAARIGASMRSVGVHQGLAPVLDVVCDPRWGRVEETIGEDPYLVGTVASAYVRGLEGAGIIATLKHFAGYSASKAGRNLAPVSMGPREFADVILPPFEMAIRETGVRSVMHAYVDVDGIPAAANRELLTGLLRDTWGFAGTVVADYFGIAFLHVLHGVAASLGEAAGKALAAGIDVELPTVKTYGQPLVDEIEQGRIDESLVDTALRRVLRQKLELGMLDPGWSPLPDGMREEDLDNPEAQRGCVDLDRTEDRRLAREIAEQAVVLVKNDGTLPIENSATGRTSAGARILVTGPTADDSLTLLGCYSFPGHVGSRHPEVPMGIVIPTVLEEIRSEFPEADITYVQGASVDGLETDRIPTAVARARESDLVIALLGDRSGLFGRGTSGEGCDASDMKLPGVQEELLEALLDSGVPVVAVLVEGRPYALGSAPERAAAILTAFFPGEEGGAAIAGVLSGRVNPSGRLPVTIPRTPHGQPYTYLAARLGQKNSTSNLDPTGRYPFGHGLSYTAFEWSELTVDGASVEPTTDGAQAGSHAPLGFLDTAGHVSVGVSLHNNGSRSGVEVVQLYLHDPSASVVRPVNRLIAYARVELDVGQRAAVTFGVPADVTSFTGIDGRRIVENGAIELRLGPSSGDLRFVAALEITGEERFVDHSRPLHCEVKVDRDPHSGAHRPAPDKE
jgi:beta-xylosidase